MVSDLAKGVGLAIIGGLGVAFLTSEASAEGVTGNIRDAVPSRPADAGPAAVQSVMPEQEGQRESVREFFENRVVNVEGQATGVTTDPMGNIVRTVQIGGDRDTGFVLEERGPAGMTDPGVTPVNLADESGTGSSGGIVDRVLNAQQNDPTPSRTGSEGLSTSQVTERLRRGFGGDIG